VTAQETFEAFLGAHVWPFLKERGFKRSKGTFHRAVDDNWEIVNFQKSKYSHADEVSFTINLAIAYKCLTEGQHGWPKGKRPPEHRAELRERVGNLLNGRDTWWRVSAGADTEELADAMRTALDRYALPWLAERSTTDAVLSLLGDQERVDAEPAYLVESYKRLAEIAGRTDLVAVAAKRIAAHDEWLREYRANQS
jgi:hypothetical protein